MVAEGTPQTPGPPSVWSSMPDTHRFYQNITVVSPKGNFPELLGIKFSGLFSEVMGGVPHPGTQES